MNVEKTKKHLDILKERKKELDILVKTAYNEWTDDETVHQLKIKKLNLKDEIQKYERMLNEFESI